MDTKRGNRIFWIILIFIAIGMVAIFAGSLRKIDAQKEEAVSSANEDREDSTYERIFNPDDERIQSLIDRVSGFDGIDMDIYWSSLRLKVKDNNLLTAKEYPPIATLVSPRALMTSDAYDTFQRMDTPTIDSLRSTLQEGVIYFETKAYSSYSDFGREFHAVLKQGDTVFQPFIGYTINNVKSDVAYDSKPLGEKKYKREIGHVAFKVDRDFDFQKPIEFVFLFNGKEDYISYEFERGLFYK